MTTYKNLANRRQETREERRARTADPVLAAEAAERVNIQASNDTLQRGLKKARQQEFENRKRELDADIIGLQRMKDRAARGYSEAAAAGYARIYQRLQRLAQTLADEFEHEVSIPEWDPPVQGSNVKMTAVKPRSAAARAAESAYRETKGLGPSGKGGPLPGYPGSDADTAWLNVQGVK